MQFQHHQPDWSEVNTSSDETEIPPRKRPCTLSDVIRCSPNPKPLSIDSDATLSYSPKPSSNDSDVTRLTTAETIVISDSDATVPLFPSPPRLHIVKTKAKVKLPPPTDSTDSDATDPLI